MPSSFRCPLFAALITAAMPSLALAHPGHDDPGITWEFSHLAAHPFATVGCLAALFSAGWLCWRAAKRLSSSSAKDHPRVS